MCIYICMYIHMYIHMYSTYIYIVPLEHALYLYSTLLNGTSGMWHQRPGNSWGNWWFGGFRLVIGVALNHPLLIGNFPYKPSSFWGTNLGNPQFLDDIFWETATSFRKRDFHLGYVSKNLGFFAYPRSNLRAKEIVYCCRGTRTPWNTSRLSGPIFICFQAAGS